MKGGPFTADRGLQIGNSTTEWIERLRPIEDDSVQYRGRNVVPNREKNQKHSTLIDMKRPALLLLLAFLCTGGLFAQNDADVSRYTHNPVLGTARFNALGGAFGALGGDMTSLHVNPAGVGVYRFGELSFSPAMEMNSITGKIGSMNNEELTVKPVINNIGFVLVNEVNSNPNWRSINFAVSYNRLNTFNDKLGLHDNLASQWSLSHDFASDANGYLLSELSDYNTGLAWDTHLIDSVAPYQYESYVPSGIGVDQDQTIERSGRLAETSITVGANYLDKLYIGAGIGFQTAEFKEIAHTTETPDPNAGLDLVDYTYTERLHAQGIGVNFKLGLIYRATDYIRLGGSVQTPTVFSMSDSYSTSVSTSWIDPTEIIGSESPNSYFEYRVRTPWRLMFGAAGVIGDKAIVTAQYERVDFTGGELRNTGTGKADFSFANRTLKRDYRSADIVRAGLEYRLTKTFSARAGFAYFSNPIEVHREWYDGLELNRLDYSFGLGYRGAGWNIDAAYRLATFEEPTTISRYSNLAVVQNQLSSVVLTLGFRM